MEMAMNLQILNFLKIINTVFTKEINVLSSPDWVKLITYAELHNIVPLFYEGCCHYPEFQAVSEEVKRNLLHSSMEIIISQTQRTEAFLFIYDKLVQAGLKPLILKGLVCRDTYGELADHRPSGDEDIYIEKKDFNLCQNILQEYGYMTDYIQVSEAVLSKVQEISFSHRLSGVKIEVHINLMGLETVSRRKMDSYFTEVFSSCISCSIEKHRIYTMNHTDHFIYLFMHFYKHFTLSGVGIRQIIDILMYDRIHHADIDWAKTEIIIMEMSAGRLYADITAIGSCYLGFDLNTNLKGYNTEALLEDIMDAGVYGNSTKDRLYSRNYTLSAMDSGRSGILRMIFPKKAELGKRYTALYSKPYLLPIIWIMRWGRFLIQKKSKISQVFQGLRTGKRRVKLLKEYDII